MKRNWKQRNTQATGLLEKLLEVRGLVDPLAIENFLDPKYEKLHDPMQMLDMDKAVVRIQKAIAANEQITIYADYDADAVTAAATLLRYFQHIEYMEAARNLFLNNCTYKPLVLIVNQGLVRCFGQDPKNRRRSLRTRKYSVKLRFSVVIYFLPEKRNLTENVN